MKEYVPRVSMKRQSQTSAPVTLDAILVDDTVALVDDTTALSGGPITTAPAMRTKARTTVPSVRIKIKR